MSILKPHTTESAPEAGADAIRKAEKAMGFAPNLVRMLAESPQAAQAYLAVSELFSQTDLSPVEQQVVLLSTSFENECHYCMAAHTAGAKKAGASDEVIDALRTGGKVPDERLEALRRFVATMVKERGWVNDQGIQAFLAAGFEKRHVLDVIVGVMLKTCSNYANHVADTPLDEALEPFAWEAPQSAAEAAD